MDLVRYSNASEAQDATIILVVLKMKNREIKTVLRPVTTKWDPVVIATVIKEMQLAMMDKLMSFLEVFSESKNGDFHQVRS